MQMAPLPLPTKTTLHLAVNWTTVYRYCFHRSSEFKRLPSTVRIPGPPPMCRNAYSSQARASLWSLFPRRYIYTSDIADVDLLQLSELWYKTLKVRRDPVKVLKSLKNSYVFVVVLKREEEVEGTQTKIVGIGRAISDGAFIATICDVAVDPAHQRRGIGRKIVKYLVKVIGKRRRDALKWFGNDLLPVILMIKYKIKTLGQLGYEKHKWTIWICSFSSASGTTLLLDDRLQV